MILVFVEKLKTSSQKNNSIVCVGIDPVLEKIPLTESSVQKKIEKFYSEIFNAFESENVLPSAVKPNYAFFAQYGFPGLNALQTVIKMCQNFSLPVILDAKRGDIGSTAEAYAKEIFEFWTADATTLSPFMGTDSVQPFVKQAEKGFGIYLLNRTSNPGAADFQSLKTENLPLFLQISQKIAEWAQNASGNVGAVVGATSIEELAQIGRFFAQNSKNPVPLLIPGVGAQGGSASDVSKKLKSIYDDVSIHLINSSSGINYAYQKTDSDDFAGEAVKALKELNKEINL